MKTYLTVDEDGCENIFYGHPQRSYMDDMNWWIYADEATIYIALPKGSILKLIGKELTWNNEPYLYE